MGFPSYIDAEDRPPAYELNVGPLRLRLWWDGYDPPHATSRVAYRLSDTRRRDHHGQPQVVVEDNDIAVAYFTNDGLTDWPTAAAALLETLARHGRLQPDQELGRLHRQAAQQAGTWRHGRATVVAVDNQFLEDAEALYLCTWPTSTGQERGQVSSGPRGLWYAVTSLRRKGGSGRLVHQASGQVVYDFDSGIDRGPRCNQPECAHACIAPSGHYTRYVEPILARRPGEGRRR